jgi:hypothetical protein
VFAAHALALHRAGSRAELEEAAAGVRADLERLGEPARQALRTLMAGRLRELATS